MIGVGIDVAKSKSMVAILSDDGEIIKNPFEIANTESGLEYLCRQNNLLIVFNFKLKSVF